ncbi:hypothetical protein [Cupriavidus sp. CuC1]|uniref:hypothetical protein n=1 Tax=Cupriavidus sp. CuC1 TaxID=3373131 RepID=UPI0037D85BA5
MRFSSRLCEIKRTSGWLSTFRIGIAIDAAQSGQGRQNLAIPMDYHTLCFALISVAIGPILDWEKERNKSFTAHVDGRWFLSESTDSMQWQFAEMKQCFSVFVGVISAGASREILIGFWQINGTQLHASAENYIHEQARFDFTVGSPGSNLRKREGG